MKDTTTKVEQDRGHFRIVNSKIKVQKNPNKEDLDQYYQTYFQKRHSTSDMRIERQRVLKEARDTSFEQRKVLENVKENREYFSMDIKQIKEVKEKHEEVYKDIVGAEKRWEKKIENIYA